jgi:hypothetical protein
MKNKQFDRLLAPNLWLGIFCVLAMVGIVGLILGYIKVGLWLLAPLFIGGLIVVLVIIPLLIRANRKNRHQPNVDRPEN